MEKKLADVDRFYSAQQQKVESVFTRVYAALEQEKQGHLKELEAARATAYDSYALPQAELSRILHEMEGMRTDITQNFVQIVSTIELNAFRDIITQYYHKC